MSADKGENRKIKKLSTGSHKEDKEGKGRMDLLPCRALIAISKRLEEGAKKYSARDWDKGIPQSMLLDSAMRHLLQFMKGENNENHLVACATNILQLIEQEEKIKEGLLSKDLNDLNNN